MDWYLAALNKYAVFEGRSRRKEYWMFTLINALIIVVLSWIDMFTGWYSLEGELGMLSGLFSLAILIPSIAVGVRRLHDTDRSGWWMLLCFFPLIGVAVLLVFFVLDGTPGSNRFGEDPKQLAAQRVP
jgi:uncharacterized membrane protein YhaH (DUF805 family)